MVEPALRKRTYVIVPERPDGVARRLFGKPRRELIAEAAYYRSLGRGHGRPDPDQDWLEAEREIDVLLGEARLPV